jgi:ribosomal protein S18 acetylase RimI-like enzyme
MCDAFLDRRLQRKAERIFGRMGLNLSSELPAMAAETLVTPWRRAPEMQIVPVDDEITRTAFCRIGAACFHVPLNWFEEVFDDRMHERRDFVPWLAYVNGEPVATAATVIAAGAVGVYNVGTLPGHRGRGIGETLVRFVIEKAQQASGIGPTILQSTSYGYDLYRKMGYRTVGQVRVFTS